LIIQPDIAIYYGDAGLRVQRTENLQQAGQLAAIEIARFVGFYGPDVKSVLRDGRVIGPGFCKHAGRTCTSPSVIDIEKRYHHMPPKV